MNNILGTIIFTGVCVVSAIVAFTVGLVTLSRAQKQKHVNIWILLCFVNAAQMIGIGLSDHIVSPVYAEYGMRLAMSLGCVFQILILGFTISFSNSRSVTHRVLSLVNVLWGTGTVAIIIGTKLIVAGVTTSEFSRYAPVAGPAAPLFMLFITFTWFVSIFLLFRLHRRVVGQKRTQTAYILLAFAFGLVGSNGFMLTSMVESQTVMIFLPACVWVLFPLTITYAIIKHRLWDIRTVIHKTAAWAILSIALLAPLYLIFRLSAPFMEDLGSGDLALFVTVVFVFGYVYLRALKPRVDHLFQRREYDRQKVLDILAMEMRGLRATDDLVSQLLGTISQTLYPEKVSVLLRAEAYDRAEAQVQMIGTEWKRFKLSGGKSSVGVTSVMPEDPVVKKIMSLGKAVEVSQLAVDRRFEDLKEEAVEYFKLARIVVCLPLVHGESLIGLIHLSGKTNLKPYSRGDLEFLEKLGASAAVGVANSLLFEQVDQQRSSLEELAGSLEIEVEKRTWALKEANSALELANDELRELDKMKSRFFANISHELRTPLTLILGPADSLLSGGDGALNKEQVKTLGGIQRNAMELLKLINDLLDLSRLEEARMSVRLQRIEVKNHLDKLLDFARPMAEQKEIDLTLEAPDDLEYVGDEGKMERVFVNLISNALKFSDIGGQVNLKASTDEGNVVVTVEDNGIGIPEEYLEMIFDRFGQVDSSMTKRYGGSGIGLALARELVELHEGTLTVDSDVGYGSTFKATLPTNLEEILPEELKEKHTSQDHTSMFMRESDVVVPDWGSNLLSSPKYRFMEIERAGKADRGESKEPSSRGSQDMFKSAKILVADDNPEIVKYLEQSLSDRYDIWSAEDGQQAFGMLLHQRHDLVIADVMMPNMSGLDLCKAIKADERVQETPVILLTAHGGAKNRSEGHTVGADQYFTKPFDLNELRVAIRSLLAGRARRIEVGARRHSSSLENLLGGMAHELHNACQSVQSSQSAMWTIARRAVKDAGKPDSKSAEEVANTIDKMESISGRALTRISAVVTSLKQYTRNQMQMPWKDLELDSLIAREVRMLTAGEQKGVDLKLSLKSNVFVRAPEEELRQVILNLVENAIHAVSAGGMVEVKTVSTPGKARIVIKDDGCGIPPEIKEQIFDPFFTTKDSGSGMGLGLALCRRTIADIGGVITVRSEKDMGTEMIVELPISHYSSTGPPPAVIPMA